MVTDSDGLQEEITVLKIPCITISENTERPSIIDIGSSVVVVQIAFQYLMPLLK
ncbi:MAG: UDP-N-acetyl glucosamine 2-epimerase [Fibrobacter sp.]|nr:UDP-N-acetyl glucosamine 2-epimerase [Fibrobacter sp.]